MFTVLQLSILLSAAAVVFFCYEAIPGLLERAKGESGLHAITSSVEFTVFIRYCGLDHAIMAIGMAFMVLDVRSEWNGAVAWIIVASECVVASVSLLSFYVLKKVKA